MVSFSVCDLPAILWYFLLWLHVPFVVVSSVVTFTICGISTVVTSTICGIF